MKNQGTSYKDCYKKIVKKSNREKIVAILKENHAWEYFKIKQIEIIQAVPYAYILIELDITGDFAAQFLGMFVEIKKYFPQYNEGKFYLPAIAYPHEYYASMKPYINKELSLAHELLHLTDIIDLIENDAGYLEKIYKYGFENIKEAGELPESIDFELWKNFRIEPRALENDFKNGEKLILAPLAGLTDKMLNYETRDLKRATGE